MEPGHRLARNSSIVWNLGHDSAVWCSPVARPLPPNVSNLERHSAVRKRKLEELLEQEVLLEAQLEEHRRKRQSLQTELSRDSLLALVSESSVSSGSHICLSLQFDDDHAMFMWCGFTKVETYRSFLSLCFATMSNKPTSNSRFGVDVRLKVFLLSLAKGWSSKELEGLLLGSASISDSTIQDWMKKRCKLVFAAYLHHATSFAATECIDQPLTQLAQDAIVCPSRMC